MTNEVVRYENADVRIVEAGSGYDIIIETDDEKHSLVAHEDPIDPLWEQLVERGEVDND